MRSLLIIAALLASKTWVHVLFHLGLLGLCLLSIVDASFVPLPIPGSTDLLIALMAARAHAWLLLTCVSTVGSVLGGASCYYVGKLSGIHVVEKRVPPKYFKRITSWVEEHAYAAVAIPAVLPPPFPLIPFVMAAGALKMPPKKFYVAFTLSRFVRHALFALLGIRFAPQLKKLWPLLESRYAVAALIVFWILVVAMVAYGIVQLVRTQRSSKKASSHAAA